MSVMRSFCLAALLIPLVVLSQDANGPLLSSHDRVDGPLAGEHSVEDLRVFADGKVIYVEERTKTMDGKPEHSMFEATIGPDEMRRLAALLDSREIRFLPKKIPSKTRPIDFFWQKSLEINRTNKPQTIQIENFYPFLNVRRPIYPNALIELECSLQDIKSEAAKRTHPNENGWCRELRRSVGTARAVTSAHVPKTDSPGHAGR